MDDHNCTQEARIDLMVDMLKDIQQSQNLLLSEHYKQQGKIAVISMIFSGVVSIVAYIFGTSRS